MSEGSFYRSTERLIIRSAVLDDAEALAEARSTDFVMRYNLYEPCDAAQIKGELELYEHFVLISRATDAIIGCVCVREDDLRYHMDSKCLQAWLIYETAHQGYMAEALAVVFEELFLQRGHERLAIQILSQNRASLRLAEKLGFEREGYLKRALRNKKDEVFDVVLFSLEREAYLEKRKHFE